MSIGTDDAHAYFASDIAQHTAVYIGWRPQCSIVCPRGSSHRGTFVLGDQDWRLPHARYAMSRAGRIQTYGATPEGLAVSCTETRKEVDGPMVGTVISRDIKVSRHGEP